MAARIKLQEGEIVTNPVGRPKITTADFPTDWKERVLGEFKMGASREEIYAMLDISDRTFARLLKEDKEFLRTIKTGERYSQAWWLNVGRTQLRNKEFSYVGWYMNMKNRFDWADKQEQKHTVEMVQPILGGASANQDDTDTDAPFKLLSES
jgi:hypothetical protein